MGIFDPCVETVMFPLYLISDDLNEGLYAGVFLEVSEQLEQEKTDRVIGESSGLVFMSDDGSNKREIHKRRNELGKSTDYTAIGVDFDIASLVGIL